MTRGEIRRAERRRLAALAFKARARRARRHADSVAHLSSLTAVDPSDIKILSERADGSGVVEMPVLSTGPVDLDRTASVRGGKDDITLADLDSAVENFKQWPGPMPVHVHPHRSMSESAGPADGFVEGLFVKGKQLWGRFDLTATLFQEVKARRWRGFSVDYGRGARLATKTLKGFLVAGGVFTNRPASDVHFRVAASSNIDVDLHSVFTPMRANERVQMSDKKEQDAGELEVKLATAVEQNRVDRGAIVSLEARLADEREDRVEAEKRADEAERKLAEASVATQTYRLSADRKSSEVGHLEGCIASLETDRKDLRAKLAAKDNESLAEKVLSLCRRAVNDGVPPAKLSQFGDWEKNPVQWLTANFASLGAAEVVVKSFPREAALRLSTSGREKFTEDESSAAMSQERRENLRKLGLNPVLANVRSSEQLGELIEAGKLASVKK